MHNSLQLILLPLRGLCLQIPGKLVPNFQCICIVYSGKKYLQLLKTFCIGMDEISVAYDLCAMEN